MTPYIPTYISEDGDIWIERGVAPWPRIQAEARSIADEMGDYWSYDRTVMRYVGVEEGVRVSDENEAPCSEYPDDPEWKPCECCRTITAHHFRAVER